MKLIDWSVNGTRRQTGWRDEGARRASDPRGGGAAQLDRGPGPQPRARRAARPRGGRDGAELVVLAGEVDRPRRRRGAAGRRPSRSTAHRSPPPAAGRASSESISSPAASPSGSRARSSSSTPRSLIDPDGEIVAVYRKIHLFDVDVAGVAYRESDARAAGRRDRRRRAAISTAASTRARSQRLLRPALPELYRILAVAAPASSPSPRLHRRNRPAHWETLLRARAIENQVLRHRRRPDRPGASAFRLLGPLDDRRPLGRDPRASLPTSECFVDRRPRPRRARTRSGPRCPRSPIAAPRPTAGRLPRPLKWPFRCACVGPSRPRNSRTARCSPSAATR